MYAIFQSGSKQYRVTAGDTVDIEKIDIPNSEKVELANVLMVVDGDQIQVGTPTIENAVISGHVVGFVKGKKVIAFKSKRRKNYHRKVGHRQEYVKLHIDEIKLGSEAAVQA